MYYYLRENYDFETEIQRAEQSRERYLQKQKMRQLKKLRKKRRNVAICVWLFTLFIVFCVGKIVIAIFNPSTPASTDVVVEQSDNNGVYGSAAGQNGTNIYEQYDYYIEENLSRYKAYALLNSGMAPDDVVWQVNMNLDKPKFSCDIPASGYDDPYIIVNKYYKVPSDFRPPDLEIYDNQLLRKETGDAFIRMRNAASNEGLSIMAVSGYRSVEYQENLYNSYLESDTLENVDRYSARAGYSEHHTGMAIDLFGSEHGLRNFINTPEYPWVKENAHKYGFIIRYTETGEYITGYEFEPWHIRYVGVEVATDMKQKNIDTYEEYYAKYIYNK